MRFGRPIGAIAQRAVRGMVVGASALVLAGAASANPCGTGDYPFPFTDVAAIGDGAPAPASCRRTSRASRRGRPPPRSVRAIPYRARRSPRSCSGRSTRKCRASGAGRRWGNGGRRSGCRRCSRSPWATRCTARPTARQYGQPRTGRSCRCRPAPARSSAPGPARRTAAPCRSRRAGSTRSVALTLRPGRSTRSIPPQPLGRRRWQPPISASIRRRSPSTAAEYGRRIPIRAPFRSSRRRDRRPIRSPRSRPDSAC